jgi:predicted double-glycine peptidase
MNHIPNTQEQNNLEDRIFNLELNLERTNRLFLDLKNDLDSLKIQSTNTHQTFNNTLNLLLNNLNPVRDSINNTNSDLKKTKKYNSSSSSSDNEIEQKKNNNRFHKKNHKLNRNRTTL